MMDGVMGETHLEFGIKNLQLGANLSLKPLTNRQALLVKDGRTRLLR